LLWPGPSFPSQTVVAFIIYTLPWQLALWANDLCRTLISWWRVLGNLHSQIDLVSSRIWRYKHEAGYARCEWTFSCVSRGCGGWIGCTLSSLCAAASYVNLRRWRIMRVIGESDAPALRFLCTAARTLVESVPQWFGPQTKWTSTVPFGDIWDTNFGQSVRLASSSTS
jgi:hypothetical protein